MAIVCFTSLIALLLSYLEDKGRVKNGLKTAFVIITTIAAIHYNYGNDYKDYNDLFDELAIFGHNWSYLINNDLHTNIGWSLINVLFRPFGFYFMVAVIAVFQNYVIYRFIQKYVNRGNYTLALFIYLFNPNFYLLSFSMMRQSLAITIVLCAIVRWLSHKFIQSIILVLLAISIHTSAGIILPFLLITLIPINNGKIWAIIIFLSTCVMFLFRDFANYFYLLTVDSEELSKTMDYYSREESTGSLGLGFIVNIFPYIVSLWYIAVKGSNNSKAFIEKNYVTILASFGLLIIPFSQIVQMLSRIGYYFNILTISSIPFTYSAICNKGMRYVITFLFIILTVYGYWNFFMSPSSSYSIYYKTFHSVFELL